MSKQATRSRKAKTPEVRYPRARARDRRPAPQPPTGRSPRKVFLGALAGAAALVAVLVTVSVLGGREEAADPSAPIAGAVETAELLAGIPQRGIELGSAEAPVTLVEYADVQCPFCAQWAHDVFPALVREYVRTGEVRLEFRGLAFIGPESESALRTALAAGDQAKLWNVLDLLYRNQGPENGGWVTDDLLRSVGGAVSGLDVDRMLARRDAADVGRAITEAESRSRAAGVTGTPSFELGPTGGALRLVQVDELGADDFRTVLDAELAK